MTKIAIYARYSSDKQKAASIDDQFRKCEEKIAHDFGDEADIIYYQDKAISGSRADRPEYIQMVNDAIRGEFKVLYVDDLSRLSRDAGESHRVLKEFRFHQVRVIAVADGIDTNDEGYKLLAGFKSLINEEYLDALSKKTYRGLEGRALKGKHCGGKPYGYNIVQGEDGHDLTINQEHVQTVIDIFTMAANGYTARAIAATLNERGVPAPRRKSKLKENKWCASAIYGDMQVGTGMLNNELYVGRKVWNRRKWVKDMDGKRQPRLNPESEWMIVERPDLRIIPQDLWDRVKEIQKKTREKSENLRKGIHENARTGRSPKYLFSSLLRCGKCGGNMVIVDPRNYGCATHKNRGDAACDNGLKVKRAIVEQRLFYAIRNVLFTEENMAYFESEAKKLLTAALRAKTGDNKQHHLRLNQLEREISNLMNAIKAGIVTPTIKDELLSLEQEKVDLQRKTVVKLPDLKRMHEIMPVLKDTFQRIMSDLGQVPASQVAKLRTHLGMLFDGEISLYPDNEGNLYTDVQGNYAGLLQMAGLPQSKISLVAGAGFEPTTFRL